MDKLTSGEQRRATALELAVKSMSHDRNPMNANQLANIVIELAKKYERYISSII
jgi:hypothetical protein